MQDEASHTLDERASKLIQAGCTHHSGGAKMSTDSRVT